MDSKELDKLLERAKNLEKTFKAISGSHSTRLAKTLKESVENGEELISIITSLEEQMNNLNEAGDKLSARDKRKLAALKKTHDYLKGIVSTSAKAVALDKQDFSVKTHSLRTLFEMEKMINKVGTEEDKQLMRRKSATAVLAATKDLRSSIARTAAAGIGGATESSILSSATSIGKQGMELASQVGARVMGSVLGKFGMSALGATLGSIIGSVGVGAILAGIVTELKNFRDRMKTATLAISTGVQPGAELKETYFSYKYWLARAAASHMLEKKALDSATQIIAKGTGISMKKFLNSMDRSSINAGTLAELSYATGQQVDTVSQQMVSLYQSTYRLRGRQEGLRYVLESYREAVRVAAKVQQQTGLGSSEFMAQVAQATNSVSGFAGNIEEASIFMANIAKTSTQLGRLGPSLNQLSQATTNMANNMRGANNVLRILMMPEEGFGAIFKWGQLSPEEQFKRIKSGPLGGLLGGGTATEKAVGMLFAKSLLGMQEDTAALLVSMKNLDKNVKINEDSKEYTKKTYESVKDAAGAIGQMSAQTIALLDGISKNVQIISNKIIPPR